MEANKDATILIDCESILYKAGRGGTTATFGGPDGNTAKDCGQ